MASIQLPPQAISDAFVGAAHGDFDKVRALLEQHPALLCLSATWGETAIQAAAQLGRVDIAEYLLARGASLDICTAAMLGNEERVAAMLAADPGLAHATGAHALPVLYFPVIRNHAAIAALLLARGADVNAGAGRTTPLHGAAMFDQAEMAAWLLAHGAQINARNFAGKTALELAVESGATAVADLLRRRGGVEE
jgi:ankyrin repeat protein